MKLVNLDQTIFIPIVDESKGGVTYEMKMTVGEFFTKCCQGFEPEVVEAIPVEWIRKHEKWPIMQQGIAGMMYLWQREQEGRRA